MICPDRMQRIFLDSARHRKHRLGVFYDDVVGNARRTVDGLIATSTGWTDALRRMDAHMCVIENVVERSDRQ